MRAYFKLVNCKCGESWYIIAETRRSIAVCDNCGLLHDIWVDEFLMEGTVEEIIEYLEGESE